MACQNENSSVMSYKMLMVLHAHLSWPPPPCGSIPRTGSWEQLQLVSQDWELGTREVGGWELRGGRRVMGRGAEGEQS